MDWQSKAAIGNIVDMIRSSVCAIAENTTISQQQKTSFRTSEAIPAWVAKFSFVPPQETSIQRMFFGVIDKYNHHGCPYFRPQHTEIVLEWIGPDKSFEKNSTSTNYSETDKYHHMMQGLSGSGTVFFVYGGAFYMNRQANYRKIVSQLSSKTGLPCVTVDQRLAPQHPFPAALLDVFLAYMALLSPPPGSPHPQIPASSIVIAGDSSGGCLALGLLQLLLEIKRSGITSIKCYGRNIQLELPAGLTILSGVADLTNSLPSYQLNAKTDVFPLGPPPSSLPGFPCCEIWPSKPPRGNVYCETEMLCHPICCPIMAEDWTGAPPLWFASGQEQVIDGIKIVAKTASSQGVEVIFYEYESMPHTFMWVLSESPQHQKCWDDWIEACMMLVKGASPPSRGGFVEVLGLTTKHVKIEELTHLTAKEARDLVYKALRAFPVFVGQPHAAPKL